MTRADVNDETRKAAILRSLTIGVPAFFLALMPNKQRFRPGFFRRVVKFALPAGVITALSVYVTYGYVTRITDDVEPIPPKARASRSNVANVSGGT